MKDDSQCGIRYDILSQLHPYIRLVVMRMSIFGIEDENRKSHHPCMAKRQLDFSSDIE